MCLVSIDTATDESVYTVVGWYVIKSAQWRTHSRMAAASLSNAVYFLCASFSVLE